MTQVTLEQLMKKTFLHERDEVRLTGRVAIKKNRGKQMQLFEIRPANLNATPYKKWVRLDDMYEIQHPLAHRVEFAEDLMDAVRRVRDSKNR